MKIEEVKSYYFSLLLTGSLWGEAYTFTLVKFRDERLGRQFLEAFPDGRIVQNPDDMLKSCQQQQ
ncbi:hypothetical protein [Hymenobacter fastidiosus]|uniref:hypothetical protein n=1 Tax=Hymenobacter fastidiosus TaxID=486264 RepID=UPI0031F182D0